MSILDTFYLLFKTDIPTSVQKEIAGLDKQLDDLAKKGKKRSEEENKEYKELQKRRKEAVQGLKDQQKEVDKISDSFVGLAQNGLAALTAFASFNGLKSGILNAAALNSSLEIQSKITGQNVDELRTYSAAVESAGGSSEGFLSTINSMTAAAAQNGVAFTKVADLFDYYHEKIAGLPKQEQRRILGLGGITDPGAIAFLEQSNAKYRESIDLQEKLTKATREDYEAARTFEGARTDALHSLTSAFTHLGSDVLPTVSKELAKFDDYIKGLEKQKGGIESFFAETAAAGILAWTPLGRLVLATFLAAKEIGAAEHDIAHPSEARQSHLASLIDSWILGDENSPIPAPKAPPKSGRSGSALDFWISQSYTPAQAAGLAANEKAESGGRADARNYLKGVHYGLYQWDSRRRYQILAGTGIDVANASIDEQRQAAAWELHQRGDDARIRTAGSAESAAAITNRYFEVSGENPAHRMQIAHQLASQFSATASQNSGGGAALNVKIDKIEINAQNADASQIHQIFADGLKGHLDDLYSDSNDGIDR